MRLCYGSSGIFLRQAALTHKQRQLCTTRDIELPENCRQVSLNRFFADTKVA